MGKLRPPSETVPFVSGDSGRIHMFRWDPEAVDPDDLPVVREVPTE